MKKKIWVKFWLLGESPIQLFRLSFSTFSHFLKKDKHIYDNGKFILYFLLLLIKNMMF